MVYFFSNASMPKKKILRYTGVYISLWAKFGILIWTICVSNRWIGRVGFIDWPLRSPDLTPLDFLWR